MSAQLGSARRKAILIVTDLFPSLSQTFVANQIESLAANHEVTVCAFRDESPAIVHEQSSRIHRHVSVVIAFPRSVSFARRFLILIDGSLRVLRLLLRSRGMANRIFANLGVLKRIICLLSCAEIRDSYDLILCHFGMNGAAISLLQRAGFANGRTVVFFHGYDIRDALNAKAGKSTFLQLVNDADVTIVANSHSSSERLQKAGFPPQRIRVIPAGIFPDRFPVIGPRLRATSGRFFSIARHVEVKGLEYAIRAIARVRAAGYEASLSLFGDGPLTEQLRRIAFDEKVSESILFEGGIRQEDFNIRLSQMDAFVLPSITTSGGEMETQGLSAVEAQAMGFPVIVSRCGGLSESVIDGETGYLVPEKDAKAIAEKMISIITHRSHAKEMGKKGREFASRKFDQRAITEQVLKVAGFHG